MIWSWWKKSREPFCRQCAADLTFHKAVDLLSLCLDCAYELSGSHRKALQLVGR